MPDYFLDVGTISGNWKRLRWSCRVPEGPPRHHWRISRRELTPKDGGYESSGGPPTFTPYIDAEAIA